MIWQTHDQDFLKQALQQAQLRRGFCSPNPSVGAVVVKEGQIIGQGCHWACGFPHAESVALGALGKSAQGASLYVTLEPCSHHGRTPPCTDLIIRSGVSEVFFGMQDPNTGVSGRGAEVLRAAGIPCTQILCPQVEDFYQSYRHWLKTAQPWVTLKLAISFDGKIAGEQGKPVEISGAGCRQLTHQLRRQSDAILTTVQTILTDDPRLNVRLNNEIIAKPLYILDSHLRMPEQAKVFETCRPLTIFHGRQASAAQREILENRQVRCIAVAEGDESLDLQEILHHIGKDGRHDLWVEAGGRCFHRFMKHSLAQNVYIYVAPKILGPAATAAFTQDFNWSHDKHKISWSILGDDAVALIKII